MQIAGPHRRSPSPTYLEPTKLISVWKGEEGPGCVGGGGAGAG